MIEKERSNSEENRDPTEVEVMNARSGRRYVRNNDGGVLALKNPETIKDHAEKKANHSSMTSSITYRKSK